MRDDEIDASALHALGEDEAVPRNDVAVFAAPVAPAPSVETVGAAPAVSTDAPPLFSQSKVRKPEYWQFAKLIAPSSTLPPGKRVWTTDDAVGIWCLRCQRAFPYQKGSSQSIRYHMETKHLKELTEAQDRSSTARDAAVGTVRAANTTPTKSPSGTIGTKRGAPMRFPNASTGSENACGSTGSVGGGYDDDQSWRKNVERRNGFWKNAYWYDLQLLRRMPMAKVMLDELILAIPPCDGKRVLDLCAGTGRVAAALLGAYPTANVTLMDASSEHLMIAQKRLLALDLASNASQISNVHFLHRAFRASDMTKIDAMPADLIVGCLSLHVLVEKPKHYEAHVAGASASSGVPNAAGGHTQAQAQNTSSTSIHAYEQIFTVLFNSLAPGGHLVFGDHVGQLGLFAQMQIMAKVGFIDVDCAWRQEDSFVAGGRKPPSVFDALKPCPCEFSVVMSGPAQRHSVLGNFRSSRRSLASAGAGQRRNGIVAGVQSTLARPSVIFSSPRVNVTVAGCAAFYSAVLSCAPESPVTISPGNMATCIRISPTLQVFTPENWMKPQFFRVAVVGGSYEESSKDDRKMQIIEHFSSSTDVRFNGNRLMYVPSTMLVQITGREGSSVLTSGRALASAQHVGKTLSNQTLFTFTQMADLDPSEHIMGDFVVIKPMQSIAPISHSVPPMLMTTRRRQSSSASTVFGGISTKSSGESDMVTAMAKDGVAFVKVACGGNQTVLLFKPGKVLVLGKMESNQSSAFMDDGTDHTSPCSGIEGVESSNVIVDVACGMDHIVAITEEGYLLTWGGGQDGCLGHGHSANVRLPRTIKSLAHKRIVHVACGAKHTVALAEDGDVFAWGDGRSGALGHALSPHEQIFESVNMPMEIGSLKQRGVVKIACGDMHTAVVLGNGQLLTCGWSEYGRLGRASTRSHASCTSWFDVVDLKHILCTSVVCGAAHTLLLSHTNAVYAFGWNIHGQLGFGDCKNRLAPTRVAYFETDSIVVTSIEAGRMHSLATTHDGQLFAWGSDELGQCGIGSFPQVYTIPHLVASTVGLNVMQVAAGDAHSVMLASGSQRQLDVLESNHPVKYAQLVERYEQLVKEDSTRRDNVLAVAKRRQREHEEAMRKRKPPLDRSSLTRILRQQQLLEEAASVSIIGRPNILSYSSPSAKSHPVAPKTMRPRTANAILTRSNDRQPGAGVDASSTPRVRCSSAALCRQTRLFTFTAQQSKPMIPSNLQQQQKRPQSAIQRIQHGLGKQQPQRSTQMRQSIARALHQDTNDSMGTTKTIDPESLILRPGSTDAMAKAEHQRSLQLFPASRPKSAPHRAATCTKTIQLSLG